MAVQAIAGLGLGGCKESGSGTTTSSSSAKAAPTATPVAPGVTSSAAVLPASSSSADAGADRMLDLQGRFLKEAANRPSATPRVEDVYDAFTKAGFAFQEQQQHLASPFRAAYCVGAKTSPDIAVSVCEYTGTDVAKQGKADSEKMTILNRELFLNGATTLTVRLGAKTPEADAAKKKLVEAFGKVQAPPPPKK